MLHALTRIPGPDRGPGRGRGHRCRRGPDRRLRRGRRRLRRPLRLPRGRRRRRSGYGRAPYILNAIGPRQAKGLFAAPGRSVDADHALRIGLVQEVVDASGVDAAAARFAAEAAASGPVALHEAKSMVWQVWGRPLDNVLMEETAKRFVASRFGDEGREGLAAAVEGRRPGWAIP